ncbi:Gfo/Idh/MocA family protein [Celeribacter marinus]|uniref:D-galactose 1-dehydrogenase n=1 Tax=Celeribacter marinus TaxID=1397108 RepID=A0A0P0A958_9RHOB|nr:Gfo/Idh/MocA family oxidoreductase [Celeribacter marinus]ALI54334.1 D-galactose 1-dehydrogenase [Celeribacter marinus]SFK35726.1 Predicted dehydrogenase [Celeribacter marinus]
MKGALIGCGFFAQNQLHAWRDIDGVDIVALCDQNAERLGQSAGDFGIERTYADAADMFAAGGFDFVDIATTAPSHLPLVKMATDAGVHIICQKPFAQNLPDARAMVAAAHSANKTLMVHENFRWQSPIQAALKAVKSGAIGDPFFGRFSFRSGYDVFSGQPYLAEGARFIIEDLGIHILDIARAFLGDVSQMSATTQRVNPNIKGEDVATMLLTHHGATSVVDCSYATRRSPETFPQTLLEIDGTDGTLRLDAGYKLTISGAQTVVRDVSPPVLSWAQTPWHNIQESVLAIQQHFVDCVASGRTPQTSGADNLQTLALVEAAYLSAAEGRTVSPRAL